MASATSVYLPVRKKLVELQRQLASKKDVIMDGRDIGTVILPDAEVKIFLTASPEARARRRFIELQEKGEQVTYEEVLADMIQRDHDDETRAAAPLKQAEDAVLVDTSDLTLEQSMEAVEAVVRRALEG